MASRMTMPKGSARDGRARYWRRGTPGRAGPIPGPRHVMPLAPSNQRCSPSPKASKRMSRPNRRTMSATAQNRSTPFCWLRRPSEYASPPCLEPAPCPLASAGPSDKTFGMTSIFAGAGPYFPMTIFRVVSPGTMMCVALSAPLCSMRSVRGSPPSGWRSSSVEWKWANQGAPATARAAARAASNVTQSWAWIRSVG